MSPYDWLIPLVYGGLIIRVSVPVETGEGTMTTRDEYRSASSWSQVPAGEGGESAWWYEAGGPILSRNPWAAEKAARDFGSSLNPNWYEWVILGEYALQQRRSQVFGPLQQYAARAGIGAIDWTPYLARAAADHWARYQQPFRWLESPFAGVVVPTVGYAAIDYPALLPYIAEAEALWPQALAEQQARLASHKGVLRSINVTVATALAAFAGAAALTGNAAAAGGAAQASGAGAAATVQGAELAALVESGTVGAAGATLEAAAITGGSVTYSTATGALSALELGSAGAAMPDPAGAAAPASPGAAAPAAAPGPIESALKGALTTAGNVVKGILAGELRNALVGEEELGQVPAPAAPKINPLLVLGLTVAGALALKRKVLA